MDALVRLYLSQGERRTHRARLSLASCRASRACISARKDVGKGVSIVTGEPSNGCVNVMDLAMQCQPRGSASLPLVFLVADHGMSDVGEVRDGEHSLVQGMSEAV